MKRLCRRHGKHGLKSPGAPTERLASNKRGWKLGEGSNTFRDAGMLNDQAESSREPVGSDAATPRSFPFSNPFPPGEPSRKAQPTLAGHRPIGCLSQEQGHVKSQKVEGNELENAPNGLEYWRVLS